MMLRDLPLRRSRSADDRAMPSSPMSFWQGCWTRDVGHVVESTFALWLGEAGPWQCAQHENT